jgi:uncharacterized protein (DUF58 family)
MNPRQRRGILYVVIASSVVGGFATGERVLFYPAYLLLTVLLVAFVWAQVAIRWIYVQRHTESFYPQVGGVLEEYFTLTNRSYVPKLWLEVHDGSTLLGHRVGVVIPALLPGQLYQWQVRTPYLARGEFALGPLTIVSGDPFGLFKLSYVLPEMRQVIVYPATVSIPRSQTLAGAILGGVLQRQRSVDVTLNVSGVRDYVIGDNPATMDWRATARYRQPMVKEYDTELQGDVWVFADFSAQSLVDAPTVRRSETGVIIQPLYENPPPSTEEYTAVIAASLAKHFLALGRPVGFSAHLPAAAVYRPDRSKHQLTRVLDALGRARSVSVVSLDQMLTQHSGSIPRGRTLVVITSTLETGWIAHAQQLGRRGIRMSCVYIDPQTFANYAPSDGVKQALHAAKIPTVVVRCGDNLAAVLSQNPR